MVLTEQLDPKGFKEFKDQKATPEMLGFPEPMVLTDQQVRKDPQESTAQRVHRDLPALLDLLERLGHKDPPEQTELMELMGLLEPTEWRDLPDPRDLKELQDRLAQLDLKARLDLLDPTGRTQLFLVLKDQLDRLDLLAHQVRQDLRDLPD